jgi:membrane-associated HD superfamily phosphohydrolase
VRTHVFVATQTIAVGIVLGIVRTVIQAALMRGIFLECADVLADTVFVIVILGIIWAFVVLGT